MKTVFIDQLLPIHPDMHASFGGTLSVPYYYDILDRFFTELETKFKTEVIIACYPKCDFTKKIIDLWKGRTVLKDKTEELINKSDLVLTHYSSSIKWAKGKKILYITYKEMNERFYDAVAIMARGEHPFRKDYQTGLLVNMENPEWGKIREFIDG